LISDGINFAFSYWLYTAAWRGRGWSRVVQAALLAAGLAAYYYLRSLSPDLFQLPPFIDLIYMIANLTEIVGIAMLFAPSASVWYRVMRAQRQEMRRWRLHLRSDKAIDDLARMWNPVLRGWIQYYGRFYRSALTSVFRHLNGLLVRWAMRKYKKLRRHKRRAEHWLGRIARKEPRLFAHWQMGVWPAAG
jgi:hypothetical protein